MTRDLARRLIAHEAGTGEHSELSEPAAFRVYEKLRQQLCTLVGVAGFQSLVSRALTMARVDAPSLSAVQVTPDGSLQGLGKFEPQNRAGEILIAEVLGLLRTFVGDALTLRLVQDLWPDAIFDDGNSGNGRKV